MATTAMMIEALVEMRRDPSTASYEHFWILVERFRADLVNQAVAILGDKNDAEDVSQESLCEAFQDLKSLRDPMKVGAWLRSINRCNALNLRRKRQRQKAHAESYESAGAETREEPSDLELVARAVDSLPEPFRAAVVLRFWEKRETPEIALILDVPVGTVKSRLSRADKMLFHKLRRVWGPKESEDANRTDDDDQWGTSS